MEGSHSPQLTAVPTLSYCCPPHLFKDPVNEHTVARPSLVFYACLGAGGKAPLRHLSAMLAGLGALHADSQVGPQVELSHPHTQQALSTDPICISSGKLSYLDAAGRILRHWGRLATAFAAAPSHLAALGPATPCIGHGSGGAGSRPSSDAH